MAKIRIVDDWLRSPASPPSHYRSVMVIAEKWAEQRVLMRSYADSRDQTRPTIFLHGEELAIGPAGIDANGPWGIHVAAGAEGRAQELAGMLEEAARRLSGSKGSPPRLVDESHTFDREPTGNWAPGSPAMPPHARSAARSRRATANPAAAAQLATRVPQAPTAAAVPAAPAARYAGAGAGAGEGVPHMAAAQPGLDPRFAPVAVRRQGGGPGGGLDRTALGYQSGAGAQSAIVRLGLSPAVSARMQHLAERVVPSDFQVSKAERDVLNALGGHGVLTARAIGHLIHAGDAVSWMEDFIRKLESFGLDLIEPGEPNGGEPTYRLR
ncbi:MAG: hypothetical protein IPI49_03200 [Myxococcales bacterium]|nr:hypothetical protein [Myxococcales bacterium]